MNQGELADISQRRRREFVGQICAGILAKSKVRFALDSLVEQSGFEPLVPPYV
jgi:hypothetical protein